MRHFEKPAEAPFWLVGVLRSIRDALGDIWERPLRLKDYTTVQLPDPADFAQGLVYDSTEQDIAYSNGAEWRYLFSGNDPAVYESHLIELGDETSAISAGAGQKIVRWPYDFVLEHPAASLGVRAFLGRASSGGNVAIDINQNGASIFATPISIDEGETTSVSAATPAVLANALLEDDAELSFDIDSAGTDAAGLKLWLIGYRLAGDEFCMMLEGDMNVSANDLEMLEGDMTDGDDLLLQQAA